MSTDFLHSNAAALDPASQIQAFPFDLVARAELAIRACTFLVNPARDGQPYSFAELHTDPPIAMHSPWDYSDVSGTLLDALTLAWRVYDARDFPFRERNNEDLVLFLR